MADFFLVHTSHQVLPVFEEALQEIPEGKIIGQATSGNELLFHISSTTARILLIQLTLPDMDGLELIHKISEKYPDIYCVPILEGSEGGDVWQQILQLNLRDVINGVVSSKALVPVLKSSVQRGKELAAQFQGSGSFRGKSYMITVASARGGTGKSIFATNLTLGMKGSGGACSLIDYSMYTGDFFTMLDFVPRNTLAEAMQGGVDQQFLKNLISDHPLGFKFLACPNENFDFYGFDYEQAKNLLQISRSLSEYVVVDTGAYDLPCTLAAIDEADLVFLMTTRDLARLLATQRYVKFLQERGVLTQKIKIIINNAEVGTEISETEIETVLEHEVTAYLPSSPIQTTFSINSGKLLLKTKEDLPLCKVIQRLGELCLQRWQT